MTIKQQSILKALGVWFKNNASVIIAFVALSWQISVKVGGYAYNKVNSFVDTVQMTSLRSYQTQRDLSEFKINQVQRDLKQDSRISTLASKINE